jgi:hypothetical protein
MKAQQQACLLAALRGWALHARGRHIYATTKEGSLLLVCGDRVRNPWESAARILSQEAPAWVFRCGGTVYTGKTFWELLLNFVDSSANHSV